MIESFASEGFKALDHVDLRVGSFTLLVGPNGCGKSSVLDGLHFICQLAEPGIRPETVFSGPRSPVRLCHPGRNEFSLYVRDAGAGLKATLGARTGGVAEGRLEFHDASGQWLDEEPVPKKSLARLARVVRLRLDAEMATRPSAREGRKARVDHDGSGLATVIAEALARRDKAMIDAIEADLAAIVPAARAVRADPREVEQHRREIVDIGGETQAFNRQAAATGRESDSRPAHGVCRRAQMGGLPPCSPRPPRRRPGRCLRGGTLPRGRAPPPAPRDPPAPR